MRAIHRPTLLTLSIALLLLVVPAITVLAQGPPDGTPGAERRSAASEARTEAQEQAAAWQALAQEKREAAMTRAEDARLFAQLQVADGNATGRFVSFAFDADAGILSNYTARADGNVTFFTSVALSAYAKAAEPVAAGNVWWMLGENATLSAHNNPAALILARAGNESLTVTYDLHEGVTAAEDNGSITLTSGASHGHLVVSGNGTLSLDGDTAAADLDPNATVLFLHHPQAGVLGVDVHERRDAIAADTLGAEISVVAVDDTPVEEKLEVGVDVATTAVSERGITLNVSSDRPEGRSIVIRADAGTVPADSAANITVLVDGANATRVNAATAALFATGNTEALFHVTLQEGAAQVIVWIPGFSSHDVEVQGTSDGTTDDGQGDGDGTGDDGNGIPAPAWAAVAAACLAAAAVQRRR